MSRLASVWLAFLCYSAPACKPTSTETAAAVRIVNTKPRCEKLGVVEGAGGDAAHAREDALEQAAERGATHILLESAHLDLEDGLTTVVTGRIFGCPPPDEVYPPTGYR